MGRGVVLYLTAGILILFIGCGGGRHTATQGQRTWSVTVADNIGRQTGPNQVAALRAATQAYRHYNAKDGADVHGGPCTPKARGLMWSCELSGAECTAAVTITFDSGTDTTGDPTNLDFRCPGGKSFGVAIAHADPR